MYSTSLYQLLKVLTWSVWINMKLKETPSVWPAWVCQSKVTWGNRGHFRVTGRGRKGGMTTCVAGERQVALEENQQLFPAPPWPWPAKPCRWVRDGWCSGRWAISASPLHQLAFVRQLWWAWLPGTFSSWKEWGEVDLLADKEADLLPRPQPLAGPLQDFPGPSEHRGEMRGQAWAGWKTLKSPQ